MGLSPAQRFGGKLFFVFFDFLTGDLSLLTEFCIIIYNRSAGRSKSILSLGCKWDEIKNQFVIMDKSFG